MRMQNSGTRRSAGSLWPPALDWWTPLMTGSSAWNAKMHQNSVALSNEWQAFVGRRVKEDFHLLQELGRAKSPDEIWNTYSNFWQKAVEDYWKEYGVVAEIGGGFIAFGMTATQRASEESEIAVPHSKAA